MLNPAQRHRCPNRVPPPSGAAQAVYCGFLEENLWPKPADQSGGAELYVDSDSESVATQTFADVAVITDLVEF